jgi:hypothetical protein
MLEVIQKTEWSKYNHAYGPATDLPDLLERLYTDIEQTDAWDDFEYKVFHQGNFYDVSPIVIPFLVDLVFYSMYKKDSLNTLWSIARYTNWHQIIDPIEWAEFIKQKEFKGIRYFNEGYAILTQQAVLKEKKAYLELLDEPYEEFYPRLLALLTLCEDENGDIPDKIERHFSNSNNEVERATCLYSFGILDYIRFQSKIENAAIYGSSIEQYVSLLMMVHNLGTNAPKELFERLLGYETEFKNLEFVERYRLIPFTIGFEIEASRYFLSLKSEDRIPCMEMLIEYVKSKQIMGLILGRGEVICDWLLLLSFGKIGILPEVDLLTDLQKEVLITIARKAWPDGSNRSLFSPFGLVDRYGFPKEAKDMVEYLGESFV